MDTHRARIEAAVAEHARRHPDAVTRFVREQGGGEMMEHTLQRIEEAPTLGAALEQVVVQGDLGKLTAEDRVNYYAQVCRSLGLNPFTQPFQYITLSGRLTLYARKDATDQLRRIYGVTIARVEREIIDDVCLVTVTARTPDGREDTDIGLVALTGLKGEAYCNAIMKATTKAKRRVTLSICGMGFLDETEVADTPDARTIRVDTHTGEILESPAALPSGDERESLIRYYGELKARAKALGGNIAPLTREMTAEDIRDMIAIAEPKVDAMEQQQPQEAAA